MRAVESMLLGSKENAVIIDLLSNGFIIQSPAKFLALALKDLEVGRSIRI
jgi:hypothetical protein